MDVNSLTEGYRQLVFVSAVLAGFSFAFLAVLLSINDKRRILSVCLAFAIVSSCLLIVSTFTGSFMVWSLSKMINMTIEEIYQRVGIVLNSSTLFFYAGIVSLLASIGLSGWIRSRVIGIISTSVALISLFFVFASAFIVGKAFQ